MTLTTYVGVIVRVECFYRFKNVSLKNYLGLFEQFHNPCLDDLSCAMVKTRVLNRLQVMAVTA